MEYKLIFSKRAAKDVKKIELAGFDIKVKEYLKIIMINPYKNPPPYEKLIGDLKGCLSRRINIKHRLVYEVLEEEKVIKILSMWSHYE